MFSEENIERTKERLVEYVKDNADDFEWKNVYSEGEYSGYWECKFKQLSDQPINNAMQVFGIDSTMDIIVETLEDFYEDFYNDYDEDDYGYDEDYNGFYDEDDDDEDEDDEYKVFISANSPLSLYEWITSDDVKSDKQTMGYIARANVESENEDEPEFVRSSTVYSVNLPSDEDKSDDTPLGKIMEGCEDLSTHEMDDMIATIVGASVESEDENKDEDGDDESSDKPSSLYEWFTQVDIKSNHVTGLITEFENKNEEVSDKEMVNHPPHYNQGKFETIDIIEDIVAGYDDPVEAYLVGTTLKYLARAPFKGAKKQDLEKAVFYLKRAIDRQQ